LWERSWSTMYVQAAPSASLPRLPLLPKVRAGRVTHVIQKHTIIDGIIQEKAA